MLGSYFEDKGPTFLHTISVDDGSGVLKQSPLVDGTRYTENTIYSVYMYIYYNNIKYGDYFCYSEFHAIMQLSDRSNVMVTTLLIYKSPS